MKRLWHKLTLLVTRSYARGVWMPLLCAVGICLLALGFIVIIDLIVGLFTCSPISLGRIIELMMDPGAFSASEKPSTVFQFIIALIGAVVFTALLITTISNMFSNQAEAYRNGETDVDLQNHTLILGTNRMFYNSLEFLLGQQGRKVVLTSQKAKEVRAKITSYIGSDRADEFIILTGDRRFVKNLERASYADAKQVYILGEDNETDHDAANISCLQELCNIHKETDNVECLIEIDNPDVLLLFSQTRLDLKGLKLRCFNRDELSAAKLLIYDESGLRLPFLSSEDESSQHLIVVGSSPLSAEIAKLYLKLAHYPNFLNKGKRSKLTIIDDYPSLNLGKQSNLKDVCHIHEYGKGTTAVDTFNGKEYEDLLDFEINHICGNIQDDHVREILESIYTNNDHINVVISSEDTDKNFRESISLPNKIYEDNCPVYVYQPVTGLVIDKDSLPYYYDNLNQFGLNISLEDIYAKQQTDLIRAVSYADLMVGVIVNNPNFSDEFIDDHFKKSNIKDQRMRINQAQHIQYIIREKGIDIDIDESFFKEMHFSWMATQLLSVYRMMPRNLWQTYANRLSSDPRDRDARIGLKGCKELSHQLFSLTSYERLEESTKEYDKTFVRHLYEYLSKRILN